MFDFIKRFFNKPQKQIEKQQTPSVASSFGGGADKEMTNAVWGKVWPAALQIDERFSSLDKAILEKIEQHIKQGILVGCAAQKMATELRPIFENAGLQRKDALNLAATTTNLTHQSIQNEISIKAKFIMGVKFKRGTHEECGVDCYKCQRYAGKRYKTYHKKDMKGLSLEQFIKWFGPPYHDGCDCSIEKIEDDALTFVKKACGEHKSKKE